MVQNEKDSFANRNRNEITKCSKLGICFCIDLALEQVVHSKNVRFFPRFRQGRVSFFFWFDRIRWRYSL
jgi:hypothetical protein